MTRRTLALGMIMVLGIAWACDRAPSRPQKTHLTVLPSSYRPGSIALSEDGAAYAYVVTEDGSQRVVDVSGTGQMYGQCSRPVFAPRTKRVLYWARLGSETLELVADGTRVPTNFSGQGVLGFSADGSRWSAIGLTPGEEPGEPGPFVLFVDGAEYGRHRDASLPSFSTDARHVAYLIERDDGRIALRVDGQDTTTFDAPEAECARAAKRAARHPDLPGRHHIQYLADGSLLIMTRDRDGWGVYRDGERLASYPASSWEGGVEECKDMASFHPVGIRTAETAAVALWWERSAGEIERWRVVRNGTPIDDVLCDGFWRAQPPELSDDGLHSAYACAARDLGAEGDVFVIKDGARYGPYKELWGIALSEDGKHVAYGATVGADALPWSLYVDGQRRSGNHQSVWRPRVGNDGVTLVWEARQEEAGRGMLGVNDRVVGSFDDVLWGPEFEADETRVAWVIRRGRKLTRVAVALDDLR